MKLLNPPEVVNNGGMQITLTHECEVLNIDQRKGVHRRIMKGYLNSEGQFVDWGSHAVDEINVDELKSLMGSIGDCSLSTIRDGIDSVKAVKTVEAKAKVVRQ